jgi:hypothetical protein
METKKTTSVMTGEFRVSFPHLFTPGEYLGKKSYSIEMLFDKSTSSVQELQAALKTAGVNKWGPNVQEWPAPLKKPIRDGDKPYGKKKEVKPEHKNMWVVKASTSADYAPPGVIGADKKPITEADLYPGCYARAALNAGAYEISEGNCGLKFYLEGVQKIKDGPAMGGRRPADQIFGAIEGAGAAFGAFDESENEIPF